MTGRIMVGVDGSAGSQQALRWAVEETRTRRAALDAVIVWQSPYEVGDPLFPVAGAKIAEEAEARLTEAIAEAAGAPPSVEVTPLVLEGDPGLTLCARAAEVDLLVVGSRGHGTVAGLLLGSVSSKCVHHSPNPVAVVRTHGPSEQAAGFSATGRILVGVDGSAGSRRALSWAVTEAEARGGRVDALSVWREGDDEMSLEWHSFPAVVQRDRATAERAGANVEQTVADVLAEHPSARVELLAVRGDPAEILCQEAAGADLLVVGSRGHGAFTGLLLGSVSSKCAHHSPGPVMIIPVNRDDLARWQRRERECGLRPGEAGRTEPESPPLALSGPAAPTAGLWPLSGGRSQPSRSTF